MGACASRASVAPQPAGVRQPEETEASTRQATHSDVLAKSAGAHEIGMHDAVPERQIAPSVSNETHNTEPGAYRCDGWIIGSRGVHAAPGLDHRALSKVSWALCAQTLPMHSSNQGDGRVMTAFSAVECVRLACPGEGEREAVLKTTKLKDAACRQQGLGELRAYLTLCANLPPDVLAGACIPRPLAVSCTAHPCELRLCLERFEGGAVDDVLALRAAAAAPIHHTAQRAADDRGAPGAVLRATARAVLRALAALDCVGWVHGDVKPSNVLCSPDGRVALCDFGTASAADGGDATHDRPVGTMLYLSPEVLEGGKVTSAADVWSLGVTLATMACGGRHPYFPDAVGAVSVVQVLSAVRAEEASRVCERLPVSVDGSMRSLIQGMLHLDPHARPPIAALLTDSALATNPADDARAVAEWLAPALRVRSSCASAATSARYVAEACARELKWCMEASGLNAHSDAPARDDVLFSVPVSVKVCASPADEVALARHPLGKPHFGTVMRPDDYAAWWASGWNDGGVARLTATGVLEILCPSGQCPEFSAAVAELCVRRFLPLHDERASIRCVEPGTFQQLGTRHGFSVGRASTGSYPRVYCALGEAVVSDGVSFSHHVQNACAEVERLMTAMGRFLPGHSVGVRLSFLEEFARQHPEALEMSTGDVVGRIVFPLTACTGLSYIDAFLRHDGSAHLAPATTFVSHAWAAPFASILEAARDNGGMASRGLNAYELRHTRTADEAVWIDVFAKNQHVIAAKDTLHELSTGVNSAHHPAYGRPRVLFVMHPWPEPVALTRVWCLFELLTACTLQAHIGMAFGAASLASFRDALEAVAGDSDEHIEGVTVDVRNSRATVAADRDLIMGLIERDYGVDAMNATVRGALYWALAASRTFVAHAFAGTGSASVALGKGALMGPVTSTEGHAPSQTLEQAQAEAPCSAGGPAVQRVIVADADCPSFFLPAGEFSIKTVSSYSGYAVAEHAATKRRFKIERFLRSEMNGWFDFKGFAPATRLAAALARSGPMHENVCVLFDAWLSPSRDMLFLVTPGGARLDAAIRAQPAAITEEHAQYVAAQLFDALRFLHSRGVAHRNIRPGCIEINSNVDIILCDFSMSFVAGDAVRTAMTDYIEATSCESPERMLNQETSSWPSDIWAAACVAAFVLLRGTYLFANSSNAATFMDVAKTVGLPGDDWFAEVGGKPRHLPPVPPRTQSVEASIRAKLPETVSDAAVRFFERAFTPDPRRRITAADALADEWLREFDADPPTSVPPLSPASLVFTEAERKLPATELFEIVCGEAEEFSKCLRG